MPERRRSVTNVRRFTESDREKLLRGVPLVVVVEVIVLPFGFAAFSGPTAAKGLW